MDPKTSSSSSFEISYLMNSCGLSEKEALTASTKLKFKTSTKPDAVLAVFQDYGFTKSDISRIISKIPLVILSDTEIIKPKLDYFNSKDISRPEFIRLFSIHPTLLGRSLENHIIPFYNCIVGTDKYVFAVFERATNSGESVERIESNIQVLRDGVPKSNNVKFIMSQPRTLLTSTDKFKDTLQEIKGMGFDNSYQYAFLTGIHALSAMKKSIW
ncbi:uncharacterized protein LOC113309832 [Papaver somniferum]|uniref:uncharacterized protein LOC113309832 n=1 Tax=Papaver somniferum TaxID=3469 RepID=UPI000E6F48C8|nr:uncharacterized protein LOC113309832 [Papaver somniferum]